MGHVSQTCILQHATIVLPDRIVAGPLCIADGHVIAEPPVRVYRLDLRDHLIFPGLVNAHEHLHLNNIPRLPHRAPFPNSYAWIAAFQPYFRNPVVAAARAIPAALRYWQGGLKNLLCGVTTVMHHDPWHPVLDDPAFPVRVLRRYGWSHSLGLGLSGWHLELAGEALASTTHLPNYGPPVAESFAATPPDTPWFIHLAEGTDALAAAEAGYLDALGGLAANTVLIHAVGLRAEDVEHVINRRASVVWCPASNIAMLRRTLNPRRLFNASRLALGSDSRLSGSRDFLDELRVALEQSDLSPAEVLRLATVAGSVVLDLPNVGGLAPGQYADLLIVRDTGENPYHTLMSLRRGDICAVVIGGRPAIADPDFAAWFAACGIATVPVVLDGRRKLMAKALLGPPGAMALEPGLSTDETER